MLPSGSRRAFRYLADGGHFFDDPEADGFEDNGYGGTHGGLVLDTPAHPVPKVVAAKPTKAAPAPSRNGTKASRPAAAARPTASRTAKKPKT